MSRPEAHDAAVFYHRYINYAKGNSIAEVIALYCRPLREFYNNLPEQKADHAYAEGKWTIKELLQHLIDTERIFSYRALRFARKDVTPLAGFEENFYAIHSNSKKRTLQSLKEEFNAVRTATDLLYQSFNDDQLNATGTASNHTITVNAIAFITYGHLLHHKAIIEERYLI